MSAPSNHVATGRSRRGSHARLARAHWGRRILVGFSALLLVVVGGGAVALDRLSGNIRTLDLTPMLGDRPSAAPVAPDGARAVNFLVMGSDTRDGANSFIGGTVEGARSDTTMVIHLSADRTWATAVSIPRDSVVDVADCYDPVSRQQVPASRRIFNDAFTTGGPACTIRTVESLTGLRIDHWVVVDFAGFKKVVDALGTVPICLAEPVNDPKHHIHLPAGRSEVDGDTALAYVRERYKIGDGSDLGRIDRQQAFVASVLQRATSAGTLANPAKSYAVLNAVTSSLVMDPELSGLPTLASFGQDVQKIGLGHIQFLTVPNEPDPEDPNRLVWSASAGPLWDALVADQRPVSSSKSAKSASSKSASAKAAATSSGRSAAKSSPTASSASQDPTSAASTPSPSSAAVLDGVTVRTAQDDICG